MSEILNNLPQIVICLIICGAKILEISIQSVRTILQVKGQKVVAAFLAFIECLIWGLVISAIITSLSGKILWLLSYGLGYAAGIFIGATIENKLALGTVNLQFMANEKDGDAIIAYLLSQGKGFTAFEGFGYDGKKYKINSVIPRREEKRLIAAIYKITTNVFVVSSEVGKTIGGYGVNGKAR